MNTEDFYVSALPPEQAYLAVSGRMKELNLSCGPSREWLETHSCIGIATYPSSKDTYLPDPELKKRVSEIFMWDDKMLFVKGIVGTVEILTCKVVQRGWYKLELGRTKFLGNPFPLVWKNQFKVLSPEIRDKFFQWADIEVW